MDNLTPLLYYLLSHGGSLPVTLAIKNGNHVIVHGRAFSTRNDQFIRIGPLGSGNVRVSIVDPVDMDALLSIPRDKTTTVRDAIGGFVSWPKKLVTLDAWVRLSNLKYKS